MNGDKQCQSYESLREYYYNLINSRDDWAFVRFYGDADTYIPQEDVQSEFELMLEDALAGKIDVILTKSIRLFARSTEDALAAIIKLKEAGVSVCFAEEDIDTMTAKGELLIILMGSWSQEKRRKISENVMWSKRKQFREGKFSLGYSAMLGFKKPAARDKNPEIDEDEAKVVRRIFTMFLDGENYTSIAKALTKDGIGTPSGMTDQWSRTTIKNILQNEKYSGNALLQKTFVESYMTKKSVPNVGQLPQYWLEGSHEAIIEMPVFELVQSEIRRRNVLGKKLHSQALLSCRIVCGVCGEHYVARIWHNAGDCRVVWKCHKRYENAKPCNTPVLSEDEVKAAFLQAYNRLLGGKEQLLGNITAAIEQLENMTELEKDISEARLVAAGLTKALQDLIRLNAHTPLKQGEYNARFEALSKKQRENQKQIETLSLDKRERLAKKERLTRFSMWLEQVKSPLADFDLVLWYASLDIITAREDGGLMFEFKDGSVVVIY
jgi:DNA invertase Pin-like site-specific DNA recombinase